MVCTLIDHSSRGDQSEREKSLSYCKIYFRTQRVQHHPLSYLSYKVPSQNTFPAFSK